MAFVDAQINTTTILWMPQIKLWALLSHKKNASRRFVITYFYSYLVKLISGTAISVSGAETVILLFASLTTK